MITFLRKKRKIYSKEEYIPSINKYIEYDEEFVSIPGFENLYKINKLGEILSLRRKELRVITKTKLGYPIIILYNAKNTQKPNKPFLIHRLLATIFIYNENPNLKTVVNHRNGIKDDNRLENLEWTTIRQNMQHSYKEGLRDIVKIGKKKRNLSDTQVEKMKELLKQGLTNREIADTIKGKWADVRYYRAFGYVGE